MAERKQTAKDSLEELTPIRLDRLEKSIKELDKRLCHRLDTLTEQVGRFTEGLTKLENLMNEGFASLDKRLDQLAGITEKQSQTVQDQVGTVNKLIEQQAVQAERHERQIDRYEGKLARYEQMLERMLSTPTA